MKKSFLISILLFSMNAFCANMDFAEFLFNEGDYFRCVTELKREMYENPNADTVKLSNLISTCCILMGDYTKADEAVINFISSDEDARYNYLLSQFLQKNYISIDTIVLNEDDDGTRIKNLSKIFQGKFKHSDTLLLNDDEIDIYNGYLKIKKKNPYLALLLSAVIPGAGRFYSERSGDGLFSLITVLTPALVGAYYFIYTDNKTAQYSSAGVFAAFYFGELYGAFNSASIYHTNKVEEYYKKVILDYSDSILRPRFSF
ncbi:MAG: hypothetical protein AB7T10_04305 [bacterium]